MQLLYRTRLALGSWRYFKLQAHNATFSIESKRSNLRHVLQIAAASTHLFPNRFSFTADFTQSSQALQTIPTETVRPWAHPDRVKREDPTDFEGD